jgi:hypothetical protein
MNSLDNILSGRETAPAQEATQEQTTQAATEQAGAEQATEQTAETTETEQAGEPGKQPPIGAIRQAAREQGEKQAAKRYTEQVADFDRRLAESNTAWERRFETLVKTFGPKAEAPPVPDIFENPNAAILHTVEPHISEMRQVLMHNSRLIAEQRHSEDVVQAADAAFTQAYQAGQLDSAEAQRILRSPNIYDAAVKWHKRQQAQAEIGDDPVAYRAKVEAEIRAKLEADAQQQAEPTQQRQQVMPSNFAAARNVGARSGPAWAGPTPLNDIFKR